MQQKEYTLPVSKEEFYKNLMQWYDKHARVLPWRKTSNPYFIYLSEIMLQQTRVEAVKSYYERFIEQVPTLQDLASLPEEKLLKLWQGLGYYRRAHNLQAAAQKIVHEHNSEFPSTFETIKQLPGVGEYTAGAIASIAFEEQVPAIDGNVLRVMARICEIKESIDEVSTKKTIRHLVKNLLPNQRIGDFNQALIEVGATVCLPNGAPLCNQCPFFTTCKTRQKQLFDQIPLKTPKKSRKIEEITIFLMQYKNKFAILKRSNSGLLASLWEFPNLKKEVAMDDAEDYLFSLGAEVTFIKQIENAKHIFTHKEWQMTTFHVFVKHEISGFVWATQDELIEQYSIPSAFAHILKYLQNN